MRVASASAWNPAIRGASPDDGQRERRQSECRGPTARPWFCPRRHGRPPLLPWPQRVTCSASTAPAAGRRPRSSRRTPSRGACRARGAGPGGRRTLLARPGHSPDLGDAGSAPGSSRGTLKRSERRGPGPLNVRFRHGVMVLHSYAPRNPPPPLPSPSARARAPVFFVNSPALLLRAAVRPRQCRPMSGSFPIGAVQQWNREVLANKSLPCGTDGAARPRHTASCSKRFRSFYAMQCAPALRAMLCPHRCMPGLGRPVPRMQGGTASSGAAAMPARARVVS